MREPSPRDSTKSPVPSGVTTAWRESAQAGQRSASAKTDPNQGIEGREMPVRMLMLGQ